MKRCLLLLILFIPAVVYSSDDSYRQAIQHRITPVGRVNVEQTAAKATEVAKPKKVDVGENIYKSYCTACHSMGVAGAPKVGNAGDWKDRQKKGIDQLVISATKGIPPGMPAKGTCAECTDTQLKAAILYMLPKKS